MNISPISDDLTPLPPDESAWLPVARAVLAGHYSDADDSTRRSVLVGLRSINHPDCQAAVQKLSRH